MIRSNGGHPGGLVEVASDGTTVWVHVGGFTVARFGRMGIDVHTADATGCLHCTHEPTVSWEQWWAFVENVFAHHYIVVADAHRPERIVRP